MVCLHDAMTLMHNYLISVSINRMLISQLKRFSVQNLCFHLDSMSNLAFISHFYAVRNAVLFLISMFQTLDAFHHFTLAALLV